MNSYRLLKGAEKDMEDLWFYLSQRNGIAADRLVAKLFNRFPMLAQFPAMGKSRDELSAGLRSFPVKPSTTTSPSSAATPNLPPIPSNKYGLKTTLHLLNTGDFPWQANTTTHSPTLKKSKSSSK